MTIPIRFALVIPSDYQNYWDWQDTERLHAAERTLAQQLFEVRDWIIREVGYAFDIDYRILYSRYALYELFLGGLNRCSQPPVRGDGTIEWQRFWNKIIPELGWPVNSQCRYIVVCIGGGPIAQASYVSRYDAGYSIIGDWQLYYAVTGNLEECCMDEQPPYNWSCYDNGIAVLGHELLHAMNVNSDGDTPKNIVVLGGWALSEQQRYDLINFNGLFLYPVPITEPLPTPVPKPPPPTMVCTPGEYKTICTDNPCGGDYYAREVYQCRSDGSCWDFLYSECPYDYSCGRSGAQPSPVCDPGSYKTVCTQNPCAGDYCAREVYKCLPDGSGFKFEYPECPYDYSCGKCTTEPPPPSQIPAPLPEPMFRPTTANLKAPILIGLGLGVAAILLAVSKSRPEMMEIKEGETIPPGYVEVG